MPKNSNFGFRVSEVNNETDYTYKKEAQKEHFESLGYEYRRELGIIFHFHR